MCGHGKLFLYEVFARQGIPDSIDSDKGTGFIPEDFRKFRYVFVIKNVCTQPYHSKFNDRAEGFIDTIKKALKKANNIVMDDFAFQWQ